MVTFAIVQETIDLLVIVSATIVTEDIVVLVNLLGEHASTVVIGLEVLLFV